MKIDETNISIERAKELILKYQETRDEEVFKSLLIKFDKYLIYLIHKFTDVYPYLLKGEDLQELYHLAILGFHQGILSLPKDWRPDGIYLWVGSYVKAVYKKTYQYKFHETSLDMVAIYHNENRGEQTHQHHEAIEEHARKMDGFLLDNFINSPLLSEDEKEYIKLRYIDGLFLKDIAKIKGMTYVGVYNKIRKIVRRLKKCFQGDNNQGEEKWKKLD